MKQKKLRQQTKRKRSFIPRVFIPKTSQEVISYMFKDVDEKTNIFKINDEEYSICIEYTDVSFAKANDEEAENIFFKWLEYLHSFREDNHISVINAGTPIKTEKYKERFIFDTDNIEDSNQLQIAEELNTIITNSLGSNEETLQTKRFVVISLKARNFLEANALFLNMFIKTEQKFKELKSKITLVSIKERLKFLYNFFNVESLETRGIENIITYAKENNMSIFDVIAPKKISMRESDFIEIDDKKFLRVLYVSKLPKSITPRFYNRLTTLEEINLITTLNISPTNSAKMIKQVDKSLSAMETERLEKIKRAGKSNLDYEWVKDKKLETRISNAEQLQYDLQKNNQKIFKNNFLVCISANSFEELEDQTRISKNH